MTRTIRWLALAALALGATQSSARAQWGYPGGYGGYGWGGWGGGGQTVQGSIASGLGQLAMGEGYYNLQTAQAASINTDTVMRWNQYWYESQLEANRNERERLARRKAAVNETAEATQKRLRDTPQPRDIYSGDALNVALEEVNDPRIYSKTLEASKVPIGGEMIRDIPFQKASAAITTSIHQLTRNGPPKLLLSPEFEQERVAIRALRAELRSQIDEGKDPDPKTLQEAIAAIHDLEMKVDKAYPKSNPARVEADKFLKSVHGLLAMMETPAVHLLLSGVENRPDATLGELLQFMRSFNLRFGVANTARQKLVYDSLYPKLVALRTQIAPALASAAPVKSTGEEPGEFFAGMQYQDLQKKVPKAPAPQAPKP
jgi:hypothetical protein